MSLLVFLSVSALTWTVLLVVLMPFAAVRPSAPSPGGSAARRCRLRRMVAAALVLVAAVPAMLWSRSGNDVVAGSRSASAAPLTDAERAVRDHPTDLASRLALARSYVTTAGPDRAITQYVAALQIDNRNAEAYASLGYLLHLSGHSANGLWMIDQALHVNPDYVEARYYRGAVLVSGLGQTDKGVRDLREYLARSPAGGYRDDAERLLLLYGQPS